MHYVVGYAELPVHEGGNKRVTSDTKPKNVFSEVRFFLDIFVRAGKCVLERLPAECLFLLIIE